MDRVPNAQIKELCRWKKGLDERIDEGILRWFSHVERIERDRIAKSLFRGLLVVVQWVGQGTNGLIKGRSV